MPNEYQIFVGKQGKKPNGKLKFGRKITKIISEK
jgi:hypothetical protein